MKRTPRLSSTSAQRRPKARFSPMPAFSPYHEVGISPIPRRSVSPNYKCDVAGERYRPKRPIRGNSPKNIRAFACSPETDSFLTLDGQDTYESQYIDCKAKLTDLQQAYSQVMQEKLTLLTSLSRPVKAWKETSNGSIQTGGVSERIADWREIADEIEDLYALLSSSHTSINYLQHKFKDLAHKVFRMQSELGVLKYQNELREATKEVKGTLVVVIQLEEVVQKRTEDLDELVESIGELRRKKMCEEEMVSVLARENSSLAVTVKECQSRSPELVSMSEAYQQLALVSAKLKQSEEKVHSFEDFIQSHSKRPL